MSIFLVIAEKSSYSKQEILDEQLKKIKYHMENACEKEEIKFLKNRYQHNFVLY